MKLPTEKDARIVTLKAQGVTFDQIAALEGYRSRQAAQQAWARAVKKFPSPSVETVRAEADALDDFMRQELMDIIRNPGHKSSAIGKIVYDPTTCTCGMLDRKVKGGGDAPHDPDCQRVPEIDQAARGRAISELRKLNGERVKLHGAAKRQPISEDEAMLQVNEFLARFPLQPQVVRAELISVEAQEHTDSRTVPSRRLVDPLTGEVQPFTGDVG